MTHSGKKFFKATLLISISALLSRLLGLLRQTLLAAKFGATSGQGYNDCYNAAFTLPDIIFNLIVFGAVSIVLIPYFSGLLKKDQIEKLHKSCSSFLNFFFIFISFFIVIGFFFAPLFVRRFLVAGWTNEQNILLTIKMTRIILLQTLFMTLSGIFGSYLNAIEKFTAYAFALLSYNIGIIFGIVVLTPFLGIEGAAWGAVIGSFTHFSIQTIGSLHNGFKFSFGLPKLTKEIKQLILVAIPRVIGISADQFVKFFIVQFASYIFTGAIFIFYNAENFSMVAYGMIAVSISTTSFPIFSKLYAAGEYNHLIDNLFQRIRSLLFLILPISILMIVFRNEIISILIGYKHFSNKDVLLTANALAYYLLGIPAFSMTILIVKFYYAQKKSVIPMIISLVSASVTVIVSYFLSKKFAVSGLSLGRSSGYILQMLLLLTMIFFYNSREKIFTIVPKKQLIEISKIIAINIIIIFIAFLIHYIFDFKFYSKLKILLFLILQTIPIIIIYFVLSYIFGLTDLKAMLKLIPINIKINKK